MATDLSDLKALVVDGNPQAIKIFKMALTGTGVHKVFTAADGRAAQEFLDAAGELVDVVICDWEMPRMSGLGLLQQVRTMHPDMPFMMLTGHTEVESVMAAKDNGVNAYIGKPYSPQQIREKLEALAKTL